MKAPALFLLVAAGVFAAGGAGAAPRRAAKPAAEPARAAGARTAPRLLDDIHIEGELPVPQVLFVSVREQRRFLDFDHARWRRDARALAASTPVPVVTLRSGSPVTPAQESAR